MKRLRFYLLLLFSGLLLHPSGGETELSGLKSKSPSKEEKVQKEGAVADSSATASTEGEPEPGAETLRSLAFQEQNPDFSFPARKARYFYNGSRNGNKICLTFDDGPHPQYTPQILTILKEKKVKATFFLTGENSRFYPHIVKSIVDAGSEVGNHSYTHPNLRNLAPEKIREELEKTQSEIKKACGISPRAVRFPYGVASAETARIAYELRLDPFFWSIDTNDYKNETTTENIIQEVLKNVKGGSIILMHDKSQKVVEAVKGLIDPLREKGFEFVTCSELAAEARLKNHKMRQGTNQEHKTGQTGNGGAK
ncbi:polysaccharide deacetylase family protein [Candidatus Sumerlaeota bacterium]|nr:polysaccharide deacetylase family protein [Candidatus Sumerlaeota bacterium]